MAFNTANDKHSKLFSDNGFVKECMVDVFEAVCPENKTAVENVRLSTRTIFVDINHLPTQSN
jgi:hypothetical protein